MTAYQNVSSALEISGEKKENKRAFITESLKSVGITEDLQHKKVGQLSGGQQQRVAVVRAMVTGADIIVADEPTGNLDPKTSDEVFAMLIDRVRKAGIGALIATHNMELAKKMDRILLMQGGELKEVGTVI